MVYDKCTLVTARCVCIVIVNIASSKPHKTTHRVSWKRLSTVNRNDFGNLFFYEMIEDCRSSRTGVIPMVLKYVY